MNIINTFIELSGISRSYCADIIGVSRPTLYKMSDSPTNDLSVHQFETMLNYLTANKIKHDVEVNGSPESRTLVLIGHKNADS